MTDVYVDRCRLSFRVEGSQEAPPLLLLNSLGTTTELWSAQLERLLPQFRVIRYDTRGHGRSDSPAGDYSLECLGRDAMAILDAAGAPHAHACGISLGGMVALWLAANAPDHIDRVVAANTGATIATPEFWEQRIAAAHAQGLPGIADAVTARWFTDRFRQTDLAITDRFRSMLSESTAQGYVGCCAALRDADLREDLERITAPVLIITGAEDKATPPEAGTFIRHRVSNARGVTLDAAHLSNVEQADAFTSAMLTFLREPD